MLIRATLVCIATLATCVAWSSHRGESLDYGLFETTRSIGDTAAEPRPAAGELLLLQFWASWCHSCGALMWDLDALLDNNTGVSYIAVSLDDNPEDAENYIRKHRLYSKYSDRYFIDSQKRLSDALGVASVPSILLINERGDVLLRKSGHLNSADFQDMVSTIRRTP